MAKNVSPLLPATTELLRQFGDRLRLARLRRRLTAKQVAERAGMVPMTLRAVERGGPGVTIGAYLAVMQVLGLEREIQSLAAEDAWGRHLQDSRLPARRAAKAPDPKVAADRKAATRAPSRRPTITVSKSGDDPGYVSAADLAALIRPSAKRPRTRR